VAPNVRHDGEQVRSLDVTRGRGTGEPEHGLSVLERPAEPCDGPGGDLGGAQTSIVCVVEARKVPGEVVSFPDEDIRSIGHGEDVEVRGEAEESTADESGDARKLPRASLNAAPEPPRTGHGARHGHEWVDGRRESEREAHGKKAATALGDETKPREGEKCQKRSERIHLDARGGLPDGRMPTEDQRNEGGERRIRLDIAVERRGQTGDGHRTQCCRNRRKQVEADQGRHPRNTREHPTDQRVERLSGGVAQSPMLRDHCEFGAVEKTEISLHGEHVREAEDGSGRPGPSPAGHGQTEGLRQRPSAHLTPRR
jgi:hypothetical protein